MSGRCRVAQLAIIKQRSGQVSRGSAGDNQSHGDYQADEWQVLRGSAGDYEAEERAGVAGLIGDDQADERAGVTRLSWRLSSR